MRDDVESATYLVDVGLLLGKVELAMTLILYLTEQIVLEEFLHDRILERSTLSIIRAQARDICMIKEVVGKARCWVVHSADFDWVGTAAAIGSVMGRV